MKNIFTIVYFIGIFLGILNEAFAQPVNATADPSSICYPGGNSQLDVELNGAPGNTFSWIPTDNLSNPNIQNPEVQSLTETTEFTVTVDGTYESSVTITVYEELIASIGSDQSICFNTSPAPLTSTVSGGDESYSYQWQIHDGSNWNNIPSATNPTYQPGALTTTTNYQLIVDDNSNCGPVTTNSITITVYENLVASIDADQTICYNTAPELLTSTVSGGDGTYSYQWQIYDGANWSFIPSATNPTYQPELLTETTQYQLAVDDGANCGPVISNSITITVYEELVASIANDQTICYNTAPELLASTVSGGNGTYSYQWQIFDGSIWTNIPTATDPTYQPDLLTETTQYHLVVDDGAGCGPVITNSVTITVHGALVASIADDQTICYNTVPEILTSIVSGGNGSYTYQWQKFEGPDWSDIPGGTNPNFQPGMLDTTSLYRLIVNDGDGCGPVTTNSVTITVYGELVASIEDDQTICFNTTPKLLTSTVLGGDGFYSYQWQIFDGSNWSIIPGETNPTYQPGLLTETTLYQLAVDDGAGCGPVVTNSITITVYDELVASIAEDQSICFNTSPAMLTSSVSGGDGSYSYQWQKFEGPDWSDIPGGTNPNFQPGILVDTTSYRLAVDDGANCGIINSNAVIINVIPNDTAFITISGKNQCCDNEAVLFSITDSINGGYDPGIEWYINDVLKTSGASFTSDELKQDDKVKAFFIPSDDVCVFDNKAVSNIITMDVNPLPAGDSIIAKYDPQNGLTPYVLIYPGNPEGHTYSYQWYQNNSLLENDTLKFYYPGEAIVPGATYKLKIENEYKCFRELTYTYTKNKSLLFESADIFNIYPNPTQGEFTIILNEDNIPENFESCTFRIIDTGGKIVYQNELDDTEQSFNINELEKGLFFIEVLVSGTQKQIKKIIFY